MDWRPLTGDEQVLLDKLLSHEFQGREQVALQARTALVKHVGTKIRPIWLFKIDESAPRAHVRQRTPVEAECVGNDQDGAVVHFVLHVIDGRLAELEIFREDGDQIVRVPEPVELRPAYP
jgi:hypothetical protein